MVGPKKQDFWPRINIVVILVLSPSALETSLTIANLEYETSRVVKFPSNETTEAIGMSGPLNPDKHRPRRLDSCTCIFNSIASVSFHISLRDMSRYCVRIIVSILPSNVSSRYSPVKLTSCRSRSDSAINFRSRLVNFPRLWSVGNGGCRHICSRISSGRSLSPTVSPPPR